MNLFGLGKEKDPLAGKGNGSSLHKVALATGILLSVGLTAYFMWAGASISWQNAMHTSNAYAARIELMLNGQFNKTDVLRAVVLSSDGTISEEAFVNIAKSFGDSDGVRAIQCQPGGTVKFCYPREGNETTFGNNVFENPKRREDALLAVRTKSIALSGPYELAQGGMGLVARNPVFQQNSAGEEEFWGFTTIILDLPRALNPIGLENLQTDGYEYRLHCVLEDGRDMTISQSEGYGKGTALDSVIHVPNHTWTLSLMRKGGWVDWWALVFFLFCGLTVSVLLASTLYQRSARQSLLHSLAYLDELTGLYNRRALLEYWAKHCAQRKDSIVFAAMDLDHFKEVNDQNGHLAGDLLLKEFSKQMKQVLGKGAVCGRVGGDEFLALLPGDEKDAMDQIQRLGELQFQVTGVDGPIQVSCSIGAAVFPAEGKTYDELMLIADQRMYEKKRGKSQKAPLEEDAP